MLFHTWGSSKGGGIDSDCMSVLVAVYDTAKSSVPEPVLVKLLRVNFSTSALRSTYKEKHCFKQITPRPCTLKLNKVSKVKSLWVFLSYKAGSLCLSRDISRNVY